MSDGDVIGSWDAAAETFDDEPHHALDEPAMRGAWWDVLEQVLPLPPCRVADIGCGTGSLSTLLAERGHQVVGVDVSPRMLDRARAKADRLGVEVGFLVGDAAAPPLARASFDVVVTRHVLWALDYPADVLDCWLELLAPGGRLVLIEGVWATGTGISSRDLDALVSRPGVSTETLDLSDPMLWGYPLTDTRYVLVART